MITVEEHLRRILELTPAVAARDVPLLQAVGSVLAEDVRARLAVPPFDNSAMDGFAVQSADVAAASRERPAVIDVLADVPAGSAGSPTVTAGHAARIMTGAPLPPGADAVVMVENTDQQPGWSATPPARIQVFAPSPVGTHVRRAGEDVMPGTPVLPTGRVVGPRDVAAAASVGYGRLRVHPLPRVGVLPTGDELAAPGAELRPGQIPDSNGPLLRALLPALGATAVDFGVAADNPQQFLANLTAGLDSVDVVVTVGGISTGAFDVVIAALSTLPQFTFDKVSMQPGKPQGLGLLTAPDGHPVLLLCLPGNPVSAYISALLFLKPTLDVMAHRVDRNDPALVSPPLLDAVADVGWRCSVGRRQYIPVALEKRGTTLHVHPSAPGGSGSHLVASLAAAEGLGVVEAKRDHVRPGDLVRVLPLPWGG